MTAIVFSGQGAQKAGMGKDLYDRYPQKAEFLREILKCSKEELYTDGGGALFLNPEYLQPVLFAVSALWYDKYSEENPAPSMCAGHSLGEYAALYCSGALKYEEGIKLLQKRGQLTKRVKNGKMAAITGISPEKLAVALKENGFDTGIMANFNTPFQTVISGEESVILRAEEIFSQKDGVNITLLNVSCAFHTEFMKSCSDEFNKYLSNVPFTKPQIPVISNTFAKPYGEDVFQILKYHMTSCVKWTESVNYILDSGSEITVAPPAGAMLGMIRKIKKERCVI